MSKMEFMMVGASDLTVLNDTVNKHLAQGWQCSGSLVFIPELKQATGEVRGATLMQPLVREVPMTTLYELYVSNGGNFAMEVQRDFIDRGWEPLGGPFMYHHPGKDNERAPAMAQAFVMKVPGKVRKT